MPEFLAIPAWLGRPRPLDDWLRAFATLGHPCTLLMAGSEGVAINVSSLQIEAFAELEAGAVTAIDFNLQGPDPSAALTVLGSIAQDLGWELHTGDDTDET